MNQLHTANKVCGGCCAISLNTVDTESSVSPNYFISTGRLSCILGTKCQLGEPLLYSFSNLGVILVVPLLGHQFYSLRKLAHAQRFF